MEDYSALILYFGAELTRVYARTHGSQRNREDLTNRGEPSFDRATQTGFGCILPGAALSPDYFREINQPSLLERDRIYATTGSTCISPRMPFLDSWRLAHHSIAVGIQKFDKAEPASALARGRTLKSLGSPYRVASALASITADLRAAAS